MTMNEIEKKVIQKVTPTQKYREQLKKIINEINEKLKQEIKKRKLPAEIILVGSTAKDTFLKHNMDVDFFLLFRTDFEKEYIAQNTISIGRTFLKNTEESYAEHPYLRGYYKDHKIEIVPCYKIEHASQKLSAVDRTPLHTKYVKENLKEEQKKDVRLFKQFLQGIGCYGAEAEIEGFSGYLCEILIMKYDSFKSLIENAKKWKYGEKLAMSEGKYQSFDTPLTFIDPVDSSRNVSSALSKEKFELFISACKSYLKNPSITYFFPNPVKPWNLNKIKEEIQKTGNLFIGVKIKKPDIIDENLYPQIRKSARSIKDECERNDFKIYDVPFFIDERKKDIYLIVNAENRVLSDTKSHMGPPTELKKNKNEFLKKWEKNQKVTKKPYTKNGRLYVDIKRDHTILFDLLEDKLKGLSMGKHLDINVKKNYEILDPERLVNKNLDVFWTEYLDDKMPWER